MSDNQQTPIGNPTLAYWEPLARHQYNGIGELVRKTLGCGIQNIDYSYQMRGWLTKINNPTDLNIGFLPADKHFYGQKLTYDEVGNITQWDYRNAQISYGPPYDLAQRPAFNYSFSYDNLNRLTGGNLTQQGQTIFNLDNLTYDDNGNIKTLNRTMGSATDRLGYSYASNSNRLVSLSDGGTADFAKSSSYDYDANGNLTKDVGKNITAIGYNHLNLPTQITRSSGGNYNYTYTADGQKLSASFPASGTLTARQYDYVGGLVYENNKLEFIPTAEGRVLPPGRASTTVTVGGSTSGIVGVNNYYRYEYHLKDHLGNLRSACRCGEKALESSPSDSYAPLVVQEVQYDPFGLQLTGLSSVSTAGPANRFTFNGKEDEPDLGWIDFKWRHYDPSIARFFSVDRLSEKFPYMTTYQFASNDPIGKIEIDGLEGVNHNDAQKQKEEPGFFTKIVADAVTRFIMMNAELGAKITGNSNDSERTTFENAQVGFDKAVETALLIQATAEMTEPNVGGKGFNQELTKAEESANLIYPKASQETLVSMYRAASNAELKDVIGIRGFRSKNGSMEGKLFAQTFDDAMFQGRQYYSSSKQYSILQVGVPKSTMRTFEVHSMDMFVGGMKNQTIAVDNTRVNILNATYKFIKVLPAK